MGLLDQLWDDTVAGLRPETGLGRLRKQSFSGLCSNSGKEGAAKDAETGRSEGAGEEVAVRVTRSIMIITCECHAAGVARRIHAAKLALFREWNRFRRKSSSDAYGRMEGFYMRFEQI